ncbi:O-antigen polysaccharide polymerase Wzy [Priestia endophytica]|nr:O-antigen polysaccharide polymerase Wzy [Priestia endophytica]
MKSRNVYVFSNSFHFMLKIGSLLLGAVFYAWTIHFINNINKYNTSFDSLIFAFSWIGIGILVFVIITWYITTRNLFSPYIIFWVFFFIFNFGQSFMWAFGIHLPDEIGKGTISGLQPFSQSTVLKTQIYTCLCMFCFHLGALFCYKPQKRISTSDINDRNLDITYNAMWIVGCILGAISIIPTMYRALNFFVVASQYGYKAIYYSDHASQGGVTMILEMFFLPSLVFLLIGSKYNKKVRYVVYTIFIIYLGINLLSGDRGSWIYKLLVFIWLHSQFVKSISAKKLIKYIVIVLFFVYSLSVITAFRNIGLENLNITNVIEIMFEGESPITQAFFEMGESMSILSALLLSSNLDAYWDYGNTYLTALLGVVSTRTLSILQVPFVLVDNWFSQDYLGISWGAGFSMIGEAYLNGGMYFAPIIMLVLGMTIGSVLYIDIKLIPKNHPIRFAFVAVSLGIVIGLSRSTVYLFFKTWFYGIAVPSILIYLLIQFHNRKKNLSRSNLSQHKQINKSI